MLPILVYTVHSDKLKSNARDIWSTQSQSGIAWSYKRHDGEKKTRIKLTHLMQNHEILDPALWRCSTSVLGLNLIIVYSFNLRKKLDKTWSLYSSDLFISNIRNVIFMFSLVVQYLFVVVEVWNPYLLKHGLVQNSSWWSCYGKLFQWLC